jgi:hypothetical protein
MDTAFVKERTFTFVHPIEAQTRPSPDQDFLPAGTPSSIPGYVTPDGRLTVWPFKDLLKHKTLFREFARRGCTLEDIRQFEQDYGNLKGEVLDAYLDQRGKVVGVFRSGSTATPGPDLVEEARAMRRYVDLWDMAQQPDGHDRLKEHIRFEFTAEAPRGTYARLAKALQLAEALGLSHSVPGFSTELIHEVLRGAARRLLEDEGIPQAPALEPGGGGGMGHEALEHPHLRATWESVCQELAEEFARRGAVGNRRAVYVSATDDPQGSQPPEVIFPSPRHPEWSALVQNEDRRSLAVDWLREVVNGRMRGVIDAHLLADREGGRSLHLLPRTLMSALWLQFAEEIAVNVPYLQCQTCGKRYRADAAHKDRVYCSPRCKQQAHRQKQEQARQFKAEGWSDERIAGVLGSDVDKISKWVAPEKAKQLRAEGWSDERIAEVLGSDVDTVKKWVVVRKRKKPDAKETEGQG